MNQRNEQHTDPTETTRRIVFMCLAVVFLVVILRGIGGIAVVSKAHVHARIFVRDEVTDISEIAKECRRRTLYHYEKLSAVIRALSRIKKELRAAFESEESTVFRQEDREHSNTFRYGAI